MCLYPTLRTNPKYKPNKKNGGHVPPLTDERIKLVPTGCGKCMECRKQKARDWNVRLHEELKTNNKAIFITLTFSNEKYTETYNAILKRHQELEIQPPEGYEMDNQIATYAIRHWLENYRKKYKRHVRHWLVTELGHEGSENIHLHGILWLDKNQSINAILDKWIYGFVWDGNTKNGKKENYVNGKTINYITKYVNKADEKHRNYKSIVLCSKGIGKGYTQQSKGDHVKNKYNGNKTREYYRTPTGHKLALPIYLRNKIYSEEEREKLWIQKIDKQERYVNGIKIDISQGEEEYYKALNTARQLNKELGYGDNNKTWEQEEYEKQRRILKQKERMKNNNNKEPKQQGLGE